MTARNKSPRLERQFARRLESFLGRLARYRDNPDPETIHAVRTSFRRLEACYSIFPLNRRSAQAAHFMTLAGEFFSLNSMIRDGDVMLEKLQQATAAGLVDPDDFARLGSELADSRRERLAQAMELAHQLALLPAPLLHADQRALRKGLRTQLRRRVGRISAALPEIAADEHDSEQIHGMRKQVKKLNYLLELKVDPTRFSPMSHLKEIQTLAGEIHDCDVTLAYLSESATVIENSAALQAAEAATRHATYQKLLHCLEQVNWHALPRTA